MAEVGVAHMRTVETDDRWDISRRPHTKKKLEILRKSFDAWLTIWNGDNQRKWVANEWYVVDLFAGSGVHTDGGQIVYGSPLIFLDSIAQKLESIAQKKDRLTGNLKIKLFFVDYTKSVFDCLRENVDEFIRDNPQIKDIVEIKLYNKDCNEVTSDIMSQMRNTGQNPLFALIDPWGIKIEKTTVEQIIALRNPKDIMFNYILEGVRRTSGVARKAYSGKKITDREIKTIETLKKFIGDDIDVIESSDMEILEGYVDSVFTNRDMRVVVCNMEYPDRKDILYHLLYASKNTTIAKIVASIYNKEIRKFHEEKSGGQLTFGKGFDEESTIMFIPKIREIKRK